MPDTPNREMKAARRLLPWALLGVAVVAAIAVARRGPSAPPEPPADAGSWRPGPGSGTSSAGASSQPPPMTELELRDFRIHLAHEQCEDGAKRYNTLLGLPETDQKGLMVLSVCLRIGNLAWYKCVLGAKSKDQAIACNLRFMNLDNPP